MYPISLSENLGLLNDAKVTRRLRSVSCTGRLMATGMTGNRIDDALASKTLHAANTKVSNNRFKVSKDFSGRLTAFLASKHKHEALRLISLLLMPITGNQRGAFDLQVRSR